jgi:hypothetical protein
VTALTKGNTKCMLHVTADGCTRLLPNQLATSRHAGSVVNTADRDPCTEHIASTDRRRLSVSETSHFRAGHCSLSHETRLRVAGRFVVHAGQPVSPWTPFTRGRRAPRRRQDGN